MTWYFIYLISLCSLPLPCFVAGGGGGGEQLWRSKLLFKSIFLVTFLFFVDLLERFLVNGYL